MEMTKSVGGSKLYLSFEEVSRANEKWNRISIKNNYNTYNWGAILVFIHLLSVVLGFRRSSAQREVGIVFLFPLAAGGLAVDKRGEYQWQESMWCPGEAVASWTIYRTSPSGKFRRMRSCLFWWDLHCLGFSRVLKHSCTVTAPAQLLNAKTFKAVVLKRP